jgi:chorismate lyase / 3-hydroxybenzoate synthase
MRAPSGLHLDFLSPAECHAARWRDVLGIASFNGTAVDTPTGLGKVPIAQVSMPVLPPATHVCEVWRHEAAGESGDCGRVRFRRSADLLFGCIAVPEREAPAAESTSAESPPAEASPAEAGPAEAGPAEAGLAEARVRTRAGLSPLHAATTELYRQICATLDAYGYPYLVRVWNYVPDINRDSHGTERYRQFNRARQHALQASGRPLTGRVPAASALGAAAGSPLVAYFLAARSAPTFVENPRQLSAYHYPRRYGTHSPVFSRATLMRQPESLALFISGTASIVGHRSLHAGDAAAQTRETLTNIEALLGEANRAAGGPHFTLGTLACKVYVRRPEDLPVIQAELGSALGNQARAIYLKADICRQDLLVEIEAAAISSSAARG